MSTRSSIAVRRADGKIKAVYCHSDGYYSWNGQMLMQHYHSAFMAASLIALGNLSVLQEKIGEKHDFDWLYKLPDELRKAGIPDREMWAIRDADPRMNWCRSYMRDRGTPDCEGVIYDDVQTYTNEHASEFGYAYLWQHETWWTYYYEELPEGSIRYSWKSLHDVLMVEDDTNIVYPIRVGPKPFLRRRSLRLRDERAAPGTTRLQGNRAIVI